MVAMQNPAATHNDPSLPLARNSAHRRELESGRFLRISCRRAPRFRDHNINLISDFRIRFLDLSNPQPKIHNPKS
jgi:hypothetical protein